jgi:hypothetical protein
VTVASAGPQVQALGVTGGGRAAQGDGQVIQGRIAVRGNGIITVDEVVTQGPGRVGR